MHLTVYFASKKCTICTFINCGKKLKITLIFLLWEQELQELCCGSGISWEVLWQAIAPFFFIKNSTKTFSFSSIRTSPSAKDECFCKCHSLTKLKNSVIFWSCNEVQKYWNTSVKWPLNPSSPNSDQHQFSPNNIHMLPRGMVMRVNKMITKEKMLWSAIKLSLLIL